MKIKKESKKLALTEIILLVLATISFAYTIGSSIPVVSAQTDKCLIAGGHVWEQGANVYSYNCHPDSGCTSGATLSSENICNAIGQGAFCIQDKSGNLIIKEPSSVLQSCENRLTLWRERTHQGSNPSTPTIPNPTQVGADIATNQITETVENRISGGNTNPTQGTQQSADCIFCLENEDPVTCAAQCGTGGGTTTPTPQTPGTQPGAGEAGTGFLSQLKGQLGKFFFKGTEESFGANTYAAVYAYVTGLYTTISIVLTTGDTGRAIEAGIRRGAGAAAGSYVGYLAASIAGGPAGLIAGVGAYFGVKLFDKFFKRTQDRTLTFQCKPWQAQTGASESACASCNNQLFPCTEYQCRSLGANCELINKETDDPRCVLKDPRDVDELFIEPNEEDLLEGYRHNPLPRGQYGVEIKYENEECLPAFTPFTFGIELFKSEADKVPKEGYCKLEFESTENFEDMTIDFGGRNTRHTEHSHIMSFPGVAYIQDYLDKLELDGEAVSEITNDGEYEVYVRCENVNGIVNREEFLFKFCIDKEPDNTPPVIRNFNFGNPTAIGFFDEDETREISVQAYVNKPSQCKWSHEDKQYSEMENSLNCADSLASINHQLSYTCSGTLTGLENQVENDFFFRCNDTFGNVNTQSTELTLIGTRPLVISEAGPNGTTIKDSTDSIKVTLEVETTAGYQEGNAICEYSGTGNPGSYIRFSKTDSHLHSTNVWLGQGSYNYYIRCNDEANNAATTQVSFTVETDTQAPRVVRVYKEENKLKIITNEPAECVYSNVDNGYLFDDGIAMQALSSGTEENKEHFTDWEPNRNYYIKCRDEFLNEPVPGPYSIIVKPFESS